MPAQPAPARQAEHDGPRLAATDIARLYQSVLDARDGQRFAEALEKSDRLLKALSGMLPPNHPELLRQSTLRASIWNRTEDHKNADEVLAGVIPAMRQHYERKHPELEPLDFAQALYVQAVAKLSAGHPVSALLSCDEAIRVLDASGLGGDELKPMCLKLRGIIRGVAGDFVSARSDFESALALCRNLPEGTPTLSVTLNTSLAVICVTDARVRRELGRDGQVAELLAAARAFLGEADAAAARLPAGRAQSALRNLSIQRAGVELESSAATEVSAARRKLLATIDSAINGLGPRVSYEKALYLHERAVQRALGGDGPGAAADFAACENLLDKVGGLHSELRELNRSDFALYLLKYKGDQAGAMKRQAAALDAVFTRLVNEFDYQSERQRLAHLIQSQDRLKEYLGLAIETGADPGSVYAEAIPWKGILFERSAAEQFLGTLTAGDRGRLEGISARLVQLKRDAREKLMAGIGEKELNVLMTRVEGGEQEYRRWFRPPPPPRTSPAAVAGRITPGAAFVDYFVYTRPVREPGGMAWRGELRVAAFVSRPGEPVRLRTLKDPVHKLTRLIERWHDLMVESARSRGKLAAFEEVSSQLDEAIWGPIRELVSGAEVLVICPDDFLWRVPFAALKGDRTKYLVQEKTIAYVLSANQLVRDDTIRHATPAVHLVVGDVSYGRGLTDLPQAAVAVDRVRNATLSQPGRRVVVLEKGEATKKRFLGELGLNPEYVTVIGHGPIPKKPRTGAAHAMADDWLDRTDVGFRSRWTFATMEFGMPLAGASLGADHAPTFDAEPESWLVLDELEPLPSSTRRRLEYWGCSSGVGTGVAGEGFLGFTRRFQLMGYSTVLSGLWETHTSPSLHLAAVYHEAVWRKQQPDAWALRQAQEDAIRNGGSNAHPYNWAAWSLVGASGIFDRPPQEPRLPDQIESRGIENTPDSGHSWPTWVVLVGVIGSIKLVLLLRRWRSADSVTRR